MNPTSAASFKSVLIIDLGNNNEMHIVDIQDFDDDLKRCFDEKFTKICEGNSSTQISTVKKRLENFLLEKRGTTLELGAVAEFLIHQYLNEVGLEPQFLFFNLEERSIKKGFDGYYFYQDEEWVFESKSGSINTKGISHPFKINEAYFDLKAKISGGVPNNPWQNAYNHANLIDVGAKESVRKNIQNLSENYHNGTFSDIAKFNIIPGSTIFLDGKWIDNNIDEIETEIRTLVQRFSYRRIIVICITKQSLESFLEYLKSA